MKNESFQPAVASSIWELPPRTGKLQKVGLRFLCFLLILVWAGVSVLAQKDDPRPPRSFFDLEVSTTNRKVDQGFSTTYDVTLIAPPSSVADVSLSVSGLPTGVTGSFSSIEISAASPDSTLTVSASSTAAVGSDDFTITGTDGGLTIDVDKTVVVIAQPTSISFSPGMVVQGECYTISAGNAANMTLDLRYRFNGGPTQTITGWPTLNASGANSPCTSASTPVGSYRFTGYKNTAASNWVSTSKTVVVTPAPPDPDFSVSVSPGSKKVARGSSGSYKVKVTRNETFTGTVELSVSGLGSGLNGSFSSASVTFSSTSALSKMSTLTISAGTTAALVTDTFTVTGTSGSLSRDDTADVVVTDFSVSVSPGSQKVPRGSSGSYEVTVTRLGGFTGTVELSVSGLGSGAERLLFVRFGNILVHLSLVQDVDTDDQRRDYGCVGHGHLHRHGDERKPVA